MGGVIHILLVIAIIILGIDFLRERRQWRDFDFSRRI
jgi:type IV secretory pathway VirB2 component (pilin)